MRKPIVLVVLMTAILFSSQTYAQKDSKPFSFGLGFEGGPVIGDKNLKDLYSSELGMYLRFSFNAGPGYITFSPGAHLVLPQKLDTEDDIKLGTHVPYKLGYKYIIADKFFVMAEGGYARYRFYTISPDGEDINKHKNGGFCYSPSVGLNLKKFELAVKYENTIIDEKLAKYNAGLLGLRLGFNF